MPHRDYYDPEKSFCARARQVYGDGGDVSEFDVSLVVPLVLIPLRRDVLAGDGEQARRDAFEMTVGDRFE